MRSISTALKTHLAGETTTLAHLWLCTLKNGTVHAFTDHDQDITYSGIIYLASTGFTATNVSTTHALNVDNMSLEGMLKSPSITEKDLLAGLWDYAAITLYLCNYAALEQGLMYIRSGTLGNVKALRSSFTAELRGMTQPLQQNLLEYYSAGCRAVLGDSRCGKNLSAFTFSGSVTGTVNNRAWFDTVLTQTNSIIAKTITGISRAAAAVVTCTAHGFTSGQQVSFSGVVGMTQINGLTGIVNFINSNSFSINIDSTLFGIRTSGGTATLVAASEYFQNGLVTWATGLNAGLSMEVKIYNVGYVELFQAMPYIIALGDTYTIKAGCDKMLSTCINRFSNVINFRGEPHIPGMDAIMQHGL